MTCRICRGPMELDVSIVSDALRARDPGQAVPIVYRCRNGHSRRLSRVSRPNPAVPSRLLPRCAVCGVEIPRRTGVQQRKSCSRAHATFIEARRAEASKLHHATGSGPFTFLIEAQPWYQGASTVFQMKPAPPVPVPVVVWPLFPEIPAAWLEGFRAVYPIRPIRLELAVFPPLEGPEVIPTRVVKRRYRGRPVKHIVRDEQRLAWPRRAR